VADWTRARFKSEFLWRCPATSARREAALPQSPLADAATDGPGKYGAIPPPLLSSPRMGLMRARFAGNSDGSPDGGVQTIFSHYLRDELTRQAGGIQQPDFARTLATTKRVFRDSYADVRRWVDRSDSN